MAAVTTVHQVLDKVSILLQDSGRIRWTDWELQHWLNDSYRELVNLRPDVSTATDAFVCTQGARQVLTDQFEDAQRLLSVNKTLEGRALQLVPRQMLDMTRRNWHAETPTTRLEMYVFEPITPTQFWVYPPAESGTQIELTYSYLPARHSLMNDPNSDVFTSPTDEPIRVSDAYVNAMVDYILYRAYSKDAENQVAMQRAVAHYQAMSTSLGIKSQSDQAANPKGQAAG